MSLTAGTDLGRLGHQHVSHLLSRRADRTGEVVHDLALFTCILREVGLPVPSGSALLAVRGLAFLGVGDQTQFVAMLCMTLATSHEEWVLIEEAAGLFWLGGDSVPQRDHDRNSEDESASTQQSGPGSGDGQILDTRVAGAGKRVQAPRAAFSSMGKAQRTRDWQDIDYVRVLSAAQDLARSLRGGRSRRLRTSPSGELLSMRDSMRASLPYGGELIQLHRQKPTRERTRVVILCDVSSSMSAYLPTFLAFAHAMSRTCRGAETAIFNVDTLFVSDVFGRAPLTDALAWLDRRAIALAGGTRIGECLRSFTDEVEERGALNRRTIVLILSDGWDVGDQDLLDREMRRLRRAVDRIFWFDPHAAASNYEPQVQGMRTALRWVTDYSDLSSIEALEAVAKRLRSQYPVSRHPQGVPSAESIAHQRRVS